MKQLEGNEVMKQKVLICQWCFEEPVMKGKMICQTCLDSAKRQMEENKDFDLDKWLEGSEVYEKFRSDETIS